MFLLSADILRKVAPSIPAERAGKLSDLLTEICPKYGIDSADILHEFLANVLHESAAFSRYEESLNYTADALVRKFGRHRISVEQANKYGRKPGQRADQRMIANILYGGKWGERNLGNTQPEDGWNFRGAGPIQLTGRRNITLFSVYMDMVHGERYSLTELANLMRTDDRIGIHSACWIFSVAKGLNQAAEDDQMKMIVRRINGGLFGMDDRVRYYNSAKKHITEA